MPPEESMPPAAAGPAPEPRPGLRIASFPGPRTVNKYLTLYYSALRGYGFTLADGIEYTNDALRRRATDIGFLHFHWGHEHLWRRAGAADRGGWRWT